MEELDAVLAGDDLQRAARAITGMRGLSLCVWYVSIFAGMMVSNSHS